MVGGIKAISPCVKSASAKLFLDLHTVSAPSGEHDVERTLGAAAQVERAGRCCRRFDSANSQPTEPKKPRERMRTENHKKPWLPRKSVATGYAYGYGFI